MGLRVDSPVNEYVWQHGLSVGRGEMGYFVFSSPKERFEVWSLL
jgi:hypothetical protein